jgi:hypothetical protein
VRTVLLPSAHARTFRRTGGGGHDIHYGIFRAPSDGVRESAAASTDFMMSCMDWARPVTPDSRVLDLGSGHGGGAHALVAKWGCRVQARVAAQRARVQR